MPQSPTLFFVSDLHFKGERDPYYLKFCQWLSALPNDPLVLVLGGDIFDVCVGGNVIFKNEYRRYLDCIRTLAGKGHKIYHIQGNHDFLLKNFYAPAPAPAQVQVIRNSLQLNLNQKTIHLEHGDLAHPGDYGYKLMRAFLNSKFFELVSLLAPGSWQLGTGRLWSRYTHTDTPRLPEQWSSQDLLKLRTIYRNHACKKVAEGADLVLMGHCHDLDVFGIQYQSRSAKYLNCGFPKVHKKYIKATVTNNELQVTQEELFAD